MTANSTFTGRLAAAASALFLSMVLLAGTISVPTPAYAQTTVTVGEIA